MNYVPASILHYHHQLCLCTTSHYHHHSFTHQSSSSCTFISHLLHLSSLYKELICITVESPQRTNHDFFCELLRHLTTSSSIPDDAMMVLSASDLQSAVYKFLAVLDDLIIDAPLAVSCIVVLSHLVLSDDR